MISRALALAGLALVGACGGSADGCALMSCADNGTHPLTVFAAASLQPPFDKIAIAIGARYHIKPIFNYAGSQTLTAQLTQGAQADVFASADTAHMKTLQDAGLVDVAPKVFAHNRLEIAVERGNPKGIHSLGDLSRPGVVVVLADPSVPAGKYSQQALARAGVAVHPASLEAQVTAVLSKIELGEADAGIVYASDVRTAPKVDGVAIPDSQNVIADYPIATLKNAQHKGTANSFIDFVISDQGQEILKQAGFEPA